MNGTEPARRSTLSDRIDRVFTAQQNNKHLIANTGAGERIAKLNRVLDWLHSNSDRIKQALADDFSKPASEVDLTEIWLATSEIKHAIRHLKKWLRPKPVSPTLPTITTRAWIQYEPRGVVMIISPWNYPFNLTIGPLASALAAGNCIFIKPSELTPASSRLMGEMVETLFPENEVALFEGEKEVAVELLKKPFDHIFFTGSPETGKKVMRAAAEHLTSVTLELGGKSPTIIDETAHLTDAARKIIWGKFLNCGQTCIAPDYLLVHESIENALIEALKREIKRAFGDEEADRKTSPDYARLVNGHHFQRLNDLLEEAVERGAKIEIGGDRDEKDRYLSPTILSHVDAETRIMNEEIFGPLLPVIPYRSLDEVFNIINARPKPLALYIFSNNKRDTQRILANTTSGGSCINEVAFQYSHLNLPFGGVNNSGIGNAHGFYGFKAFSHERAILKHSRFSPLKLIFPPYTGMVKKLIKFVTRYF